MTSENLINALELIGLLIVVTAIVLLIVRMRRNSAYRFAVACAFLGAFLVLWVNLAVGIIGEPENLANLMYVGVLAVGLVGSIIARFQTIRMSRVMFITALTQTLVAAITLFAGLGFPPTPPESLMILNGILIALWVGSALLFQKAARAQSTAGPPLKG